jgi:hypothetical protein
MMYERKLASAAVGRVKLCIETNSRQRLFEIQSTIEKRVKSSEMDDLNRTRNVLKSQA